MKINDFIGKCISAEKGEYSSTLQCKLESIKKKYRINLLAPYLVKLLSFGGIFLEVTKSTQWRFLEIDEVENASQELNVDFVGKKLLPLIDCFDNNYLVFNVEKKSFMMINIVDEVLFPISSQMDDFLKQLGEK